MNGPHPIAEADRLAAHGRLMGTLLDLEATDRRIPCLDSSAAWAWTLEPGEDDAARDLAARLCATCPALAACGQYVTDHPEEAGVWAGLTPRQRRTQRRDAA